MTGCLGGDPSSIGVSESAIYHGSRARGYESTVRVRRWLEGFSFGSCSGTVVAPRVVITARHCITDSTAIDLAVETGREGELGQFGVAEIRTTPGQLRTDNDFAVLLMRDRVEAPSVPYAHSFDPVAGDPITLVGYGKTEDALLTIGIKYVGNADVDEWTDSYLITRGEQNGCYGDSGGTGLDGDGTLVGVITHILFGPFPDDECEGGRTGLNRVDAFVDMVDQAVADAFVCEAEEVCGDAVDDDCDGRTDDGCTILGAGCTDAVQCASGDCRAFGGPSVCTQACAPDAFPDPCPDPLECEALPDGSGACLPDPLEPPPDIVDAGADAAGDAGSGGTATYGCGCRTGGEPASTGAGALAALLALVLVARRR